MIVKGPDNVMVGLFIKNGVVARADRPIRYMLDWPTERALRTIERWAGGSTPATDEERAEIGQRADDR